MRIRRAGARHPPALGGGSFHARGDAVDDRSSLELGEHLEHLQHHLAGGRRSVERLSRGPEPDSNVVEFFGYLRELANVSAQPIDAIEEQELVDP